MPPFGSARRACLEWRTTSCKLTKGASCGRGGTRRRSRGMAAGGNGMADLEGHYREVAGLLAEGKVTPFLGAGVNLAVPGRPKPNRWKRGELLPSARELAKD